MDLLPGNIKLMLVPFVLDPKKDNAVSNVRGNDALKQALPQIFTYKDTSKPCYKRFSHGNLSFMPKAFRDIVKNDVSYRLLYNDSNVTQDESNADDLTTATMFDNIPGIQIREFLPDTKLDLMLTAVSSLLEQIGKTFQDKTLSHVGQEFVGQLEKIATQFASMNIADLQKFGKLLVEYLLGVGGDKTQVGQGTSSSFVNDLFTNSTLARFEGAYAGKCGDCLLNAMAMKIPYMLYYGLQSTTTTNIYEVPFVNEPKMLYSSSGSAGWGDSAGFISHIVDAAKGILNIGISMTPWWNTSAGLGTFEDEVVVNFDLYNDSKDLAMTNFIFINTIIPNNKWLQYGLILHSPCLYDVKVEGVKRMYACTGDFKVTYSGVLRKVTKQFIDDLVTAHINNSIADLEMEDMPNLQDAKYSTPDENGLNGYAQDFSAAESRNKAKKDNVDNVIKTLKDNIRIPDVYHVSLTFKSLLPSNLNLYLFLYVGNKNIVQQVDADGARPNDVVGNITEGIGNVANSLGKIIDEAQHSSPEGALEQIHAMRESGSASNLAGNR